MSDNGCNDFLKIILEEDDVDEDDLILDILCAEARKFEEARSHENPLGFNKDGSVKTVNRLDYSRGPKRVKVEDPWVNLLYLQLLEESSVSDPQSRDGQEFRKRFRVPYPVFQRIVKLCKDTDEEAFNYSEIDAVKQSSIPLELKILSVLRVLGAGLKFLETSDLTDRHQSVTNRNNFFKTFCRFFRFHYQEL